MTVPDNIATFVNIIQFWWQKSEVLLFEFIETLVLETIFSVKFVLTIFASYDTKIVKFAYVQAMLNHFFNRFDFLKNKNENNNQYRMYLEVCIPDNLHEHI